MDPELTATMPPRLTASTGIDALAHALECYESRGSNPLTKKLALEAFSLLKENIQGAVEGDSTARQNMSYGSMVAGMAFGNSGTTLPHALSYPLSNRGVPHGEALAMVLPCALEFNRAEDSLVAVVREVVKTVTPRWDSNWNKEEMAAEVMEDKRHLDNNPREVKVDDITSIFDRIASEFQKG